MNRHDFVLHLTGCLALSVLSVNHARCECLGYPAPIGPRTMAVEHDRYARVVYVSQSEGSDERGDGRQAHPWQTIQHALGQLQGQIQGQLQGAAAARRAAVLVASGTYAGPTLEMSEYVDLYGGFRPGDWQRDIYRHTTRLDGAGARRVLVGADHCRLDGFLVCGGALRGQGAAMLCDGASPMLTNTRFVGNKTLQPKGWNPQQLHEIANDGGAVCCLNGAKPIIRHNLFAENRTEIGRGAAISLQGRCAGEISGNLFLDNEAGIDDHSRSSDGGAISIFDWSAPQIKNNVFLENKARNTNDGGGIFVALWSSAVISGNLFVGNRSADDGGALFVGGQEHRYGVAKDDRPDKDDFCVEISANRFVGNENGKQNSGGMRVAMEARATLRNNIMARDARLYIQESDVEIVNNTFLEDVTLRKMSQFVSSPIANNVFWGGLKLPGETAITHSIVRGGHVGAGNIQAAPRFVEDQAKFPIVASTYRPSERVTEIQVAAENLREDFANRVVKVDNRWGVVKGNRADTLCVWGDISAAHELSMLPTFQLHPKSPGVDRGAAELSPVRDIHGDRRPTGAGVDIGADEMVPAKRIPPPDRPNPNNGGNR